MQIDGIFPWDKIFWNKELVVVLICFSTIWIPNSLLWIFAYDTFSLFNQLSTRGIMSKFLPCFLRVYNKKNPSPADSQFVSTCLHVFREMSPFSGRLWVCIYMSTTNKFPPLADFGFVSMCLHVYSQKVPFSDTFSVSSTCSQSKILFHW